MISLTSLSLCKGDSQNQDRANVSPHREVVLVYVLSQEKKRKSQKKQRLASFKVGFVLLGLFTVSCTRLHCVFKICQRGERKNLYGPVGEKKPK